MCAKHFIFIYNPPPPPLNLFRFRNTSVRGDGRDEVSGFRRPGGAVYYVPEGGRCFRRLQHGSAVAPLLREAGHRAFNLS